MKMTNREYSIIQSALEDAFGRRIKIYDMNGCGFGKEPMKYGVNWSAIGTVSSEEAVEFAHQLTLAANIATFLTAAEIEVEWVPSTPYTEEEKVEYLAILGRMSKEFSEGKVNEFSKYILKVGKEEK